MLESAVLPNYDARPMGLLLPSSGLLVLPFIGDLAAIVVLAKTLAISLIFNSCDLSLFILNLDRIIE